MFSALTREANVGLTNSVIAYGLVRGNASLSREVSPVTAAVSCLALSIIEKCVDYQMHSLFDPPPQTSQLREAHANYWLGTRFVLLRVLSFAALAPRMSPAKALFMIGLNETLLSCVSGALHIIGYVRARRRFSEDIRSGSNASPQTRL
jgi:hypothetical protein